MKAKQIILFLLGSLIYVAGGGWGIVEFALYMTAKDPFNWLFALPFVCGAIIMGIYFPWNTKGKYWRG